MIIFYLKITKNRSLKLNNKTNTNPIPKDKMFMSKRNNFLCLKALFSNLFSKLLLEHLMHKVMSIEFLLVKIPINKEYDWSMKFILN